MNAMKKSLGKLLKGKLSKGKAKVICALFISSGRKNGLKLTKESVMKYITGKASTLTGEEAMQIGMAIKMVEEYSWLDLKLFVKECKEKIYDK